MAKKKKAKDEKKVWKCQKCGKEIDVDGLQMTEEELEELEKNNELICYECATKVELPEGKFRISTNLVDFTTYLRNLTQYLENVAVKVSNEGLRIIAPDRAMICVCDLNLPKDFFTTFEFEGKKPIELGVDIEFLYKVISKAKTQTEIRYDKENGLWVSFDNTDFKIPIIEVQNELPPIEELKPTTTIRLEANEFRRIIEYADLISDRLTIRCNGNVVFEAEGNSSKMVSNGSLYEGKDAKASYPIEYLKKLRFPDPQVEIRFGQDYPMILTNGHFRFILAPRVTEDYGE